MTLIFAFDESKLYFVQFVRAVIFTNCCSSVPFGRLLRLLLN